MSLFSGRSCNCKRSDALVDVTDDYQQFVGALENVEFGDWVKLMRCPACGQYWKVDEWDKYQTLYAFKLPDAGNWKSVDVSPLIKERIVKSRGGLQNSMCMRAGCKNRAVVGSAYCADHLFEIGWRK